MGKKRKTPDRCSLSLSLSLRHTPCRHLLMSCCRRGGARQRLDSGTVVSWSACGGEHGPAAVGHGTRSRRGGLAVGPVEMQRRRRQTSSWEGTDGGGRRRLAEGMGETEKGVSRRDKNSIEKGGDLREKEQERREQERRSSQPRFDPIDREKIRQGRNSPFMWPTG